LLLLLLLLYLGPEGSSLLQVLLQHLLMLLNDLFGCCQVCLALL
jgi:hypothetical protein